jgi:hypothetical protein
MAQYQLPPGMSPAAIAALKEDISAYRTEFTMGDTDLEFSNWLRTQRPDRYRVYLQVTGQGK